MKQKVFFIFQAGISIRIVWLLAFLLLSFTPTSYLLAVDGSGTTDASPNEVTATLIGQSFSFTYTAEEDMGDGQLEFSTPNLWPNPSGSNLTTVLDPLEGLLADILDDLDTPVLGNPGWQTNGLFTSVSINNTDPLEGIGNVRLNLGIGVLGNRQLYFNASSTLDWSTYTHISFWLRQNTLLGLGLSEVNFLLSENNDLASAVAYPLDNAQMDPVAFGAGNWTQVIIDLSSEAVSTRDAILSFGLELSGLNVGMASRVDLDYMSLGPGSPVFDEEKAIFDFIFLNQDGVLTIQYSNITIPSTPGIYPFAMQQQVDASGSLTALSGGSPEIQVNAPECATDGDCDDANPCTDDTCNAQLECEYSNNTVACDDGNDCSENDVCSGGTCTAGSAKDCSDGIVCTSDSCNAPSGACINDAVACECTLDSDCDDANPCTEDSCNAQYQCEYSLSINSDCHEETEEEGKEIKDNEKEDDPETIKEGEKKPELPLVEKAAGGCQLTKKTKVFFKIAVFLLKEAQ